MSLVSSSVAANPTGSTCASANYNQYPTTDVFCAVASTSGLPSNYSDILGSCCKDAPVEKYADDCALYCLVVGQSVMDINKCFQDGGVKPQVIVCNGNNTATATGKPSSTSGSATVTGTDGAVTTVSPTGAAMTYQVQGVSKAGLGMLAVLFASAAVGTLL
ncbi:hypothetical protein K504DRAFT_461256 [Pleomassaria siparia CBS 279.74]|uniref:Uncharacterized protein n=1 Tax=Pleomassaria siparia CBS 279.74 TaxID=1314801 RepID=A0A6G1JW66_9PLEO|nr:hypothetical protein K504DRAFT_461256 [Pleomassaria siparia CBS 279.74]